MRAILKAQSQDIADTANEFLAELKDEHNGYYGKPHGQHAGCGYVDEETAAEILTGAVRLVRFRNLTGKDNTSPFTFHVPKKFSSVGGWQTSGGNLTIVGVEPDNTVWEYRDGRRHGLRQCLSADELVCDFTYLESNRCDITPDETTTHGSAWA